MPDYSIKRKVWQQSTTLPRSLRRQTAARILNEAWYFTTFGLAKADYGEGRSAPRPLYTLWGIPSLFLRLAIDFRWRGRLHDHTIGMFGPALYSSPTQSRNSSSAAAKLPTQRSDYVTILGGAQLKSRKGQTSPRLWFQRKRGTRYAALAKPCLCTEVLAKPSSGATDLGLLLNRALN